MNTYPHPRPAMPAIESTLTLVSTVAIAIFAALGASVAPVTEGAAQALSANVATSMVNTVNDNITVNINIIDDSKLRLICIIGACAGGLLSVFLFPPLSSDPRKQARDMAFKLLSSGIIGMLFTPAILRLANLTPDTDTVLATAGLVATTGWGVLQICVPIFTRFTGKYVASRLPGKED